MKRPIGENRNLSLKVLEPYYQEFLTMVRQEMPYRTPKGYLRWEVLSQIIASAIYFFKDRVPTNSPAVDFGHQDMALTFVQQSPIYAISTELLRAFEESDILGKKNVLLQDLADVLPVHSFIILIPENALVTHDGGSIDYLTIRLTDSRYPDRSSGERNRIKITPYANQHPLHFQWGCMDTTETHWFAATGIDEQGNFQISRDDLGATQQTPEDQKFLDKMRSLALQILLAIAYGDGLVEVQNPSSQTHGRSSGRSKPPEFWSVRFLGKGYKREYTPKGGTHRSPRGHWRIGHEKRVPCGKGRVDRKWVYIPPTFVNK